MTVYNFFFELELQKTAHKVKQEAYFKLHNKASYPNRYFVETANTSATSIIDSFRNKLRIYFLYFHKTRKVTPVKNEYRIQNLAKTEMIQVGPGPLIMFWKDWVIRLTVVEDGHYLCNVKANIFINQTFPKL